MALVGLLACSPAFAWYTLTHSFITERAYEQLPPDARAAYAPYVGFVKLSSMLPDAIQDCPTHEIDLHPTLGADLTALGNLEDKRLETLNLMTLGPKQSASALGVFLHYVQDLMHPLHTDDDPRETYQLHKAQEEATWARHASLRFQDRGIRLWPDIETWAEAEIPNANRLYAPWLEAALNGVDAFPLARTSFQGAVEATRDLWVSLWEEAVQREPAVFVQINRREAQPEQRLQVRVTSTVELDGEIQMSWRRTGTGVTVRQWQQSLENGVAWISAPSEDGRYVLHAETSAGEAEAFVDVAVRDYFDLADLQPLGYVLDARWPFSLVASRHFVRPWDIMAVGGTIDDPTTEADEALNASLIPGAFTHIIIYLGRDANGHPHAMEMTQDLTKTIHQLRVARLPEGLSDEAPDTLGLATVDIGLSNDRWHWSRTLRPEQREVIEKAKPSLLAELQSDWEQGFPYQLEFQWSGDLSDQDVWLVDDGRSGGASCTDYWLSLFEDVAGICIGGSRMSAAEIIDYFLNDPVASRVEVPAELNPFPIPVTVRSLVMLGYTPVDPPAHYFVCSKEAEVGLPIPSRLILSPDLGAPSYLPTFSIFPIKSYDSWLPMRKAAGAIMSWLDSMARVDSTAIQPPPTSYSQR